MEEQNEAPNLIKKDLRRLGTVLIVIAALFFGIQYLAIKTDYISKISHNLYLATLKN